MRRTELLLRPPLQAVVDAVRRGEGGPQVMAALEDLVRTWHSH
jgi:hypothetical protein